MGESMLADRLERIRCGFIDTPVIPLNHDRLDLFVKVEYCNLNGNIKDRSAYIMLQRAVQRGELTPHSTVVESSSGNLAISLASLCRMLAIPFIPVIDPNINAPTEALLRATCDRVEKVTERDETSGFLCTRLAKVKELAKELDDPFWPNQYSNTDAVAAHFDMTGAEICRTFDNLDYIFVGVGTAATIAGISRRVKQHLPHTKVIAVDAAGSAIFEQPTRPRYIPGIGSSIRPPLLGEAEIDDIVIVEEDETVTACHRLLANFGFFCGGSTGSSYAAIERYFASYSGPRPSVLFLCADRGTAYAQTIYKPGWLEKVRNSSRAS